MRLWLGPWERSLLAGIMCWHAPTGVLASVDLRSLTQQASPGPVATGAGLFVTSDATALSAAYREIPSTLNNAARNAMRTFLQLPDPVVATTRRDLVIDLLTRHSVSDGSTFAKPLLPNRRRRLALSVGGVEFEQEIDPSSPFWAKVVAVYQADYRAHRARVLAGQALPDHHRRWLGKLLQKLPFDYRLFIPPDLPDETPLEPATTLIESFNGINSTTLGVDLGAWVEYNANVVDGTMWSNDSNEAIVLAAATATTARAPADLSSDDMEVSIDLTALGSGASNDQFGPVARFSATEETGYYPRALQVFDELYLDKVVAGTPTNLGSGQAITFALPDPIKVSIDGSTLKAYYNGVEKYSITDTAITGHTRGGLYGYRGGASANGDNWTATDIAAAGRIFALAGQSGGLVGHARGLVA